MGFSICLAREVDGKLVELPDSNWPEPGWDSGRYGMDHEYYGDLISGPHTLGEIGDHDEGWWVINAEQRDGLRAKYPDNPRCQRLCDLLESDPTMVVFVS